MTDLNAESVVLLAEALAYVEYASTDWNDWATEEENRRRQQRAYKLARRLRAHIDGVEIRGEGRERHGIVLKGRPIRPERIDGSGAAK